MEAVSRMLFWYIIPALYLTDEAAELIRFITNTIPQGVVAVVIIIRPAST